MPKPVLMASMAPLSYKMDEGATPGNMTQTIETYNPAPQGMDEEVYIEGTLIFCPIKGPVMVDRYHSKDMGVEVEKIIYDHTIRIYVSTAYMCECGKYHTLTKAYEVPWGGY